MRMTHRYIITLVIVAIGLAAVIVDPPFLRGRTGLPSGMFFIAVVGYAVSFWVVRFRRRMRLDEREAQMLCRIDYLTVRWLLALLFLANLVIWLGAERCWPIRDFLNSNWLVLTVLAIIGTESITGLIVFRED